MERYRNLNGESGVDAYRLGDDFIAVRFNPGGGIYWYTRESVGDGHLAALKQLAREGRGLSTYISQHPAVRDGYAKKEPAD